MIVYITRPDNHEVVMGGYRYVCLWTDEPHYHHWPTPGYVPLPGTDQTATYYDVGWAFKGDRKDCCRAKPLVSQNQVLEENAWRLILWSCIPKSARVNLADTFTWADTLLPGQDARSEFAESNMHTLLAHFNERSDIEANVHYRRFLMQANLITGECQLVEPVVHFYDTSSTVRTFDIQEPYASRRNYACPKMDADMLF